MTTRGGPVGNRVTPGGSGDSVKTEFFAEHDLRYLNHLMPVQFSSPVFQLFFWAPEGVPVNSVYDQDSQNGAPLVVVRSLNLVLCDPTDCSMPGFPVLHYLPESAQTRVHWVSDATQPSHPLSSPSPPAFNLSQHQGLFKWISSLHQVAEGLELQPQ